MSCGNCESYAEECFRPDGDPCKCKCHGEDEFYRASGEMVCVSCDRPYRKHARGGPIGMDDQRFLRRLCDGSLVKL